MASSFAQSIYKHRLDSKIGNAEVMEIYKNILRQTG
jgi:hypothetical protein